MEMRKDINNQVAKQVRTLKNHLQHQDNALTAFFISQVHSLRNFLHGFFR
jgi:hypothetical protein